MIPANRHGDCSAPMYWWGSPSSVAALTVFSQDAGNYISPVPAPIFVMHLISLLQSSAEVYDEQEILDIARKMNKHMVLTFSRSVTGSQHVQGLVMLQGPQCCHCSPSRNAVAVHSVVHSLVHSLATPIWNKSQLQQIKILFRRISCLFFFLKFITIFFSEGHSSSLGSGPWPQMHRVSGRP